MHRLFFALWPDDAVRKSMAETAAALWRAHPAHGRAIRPERLHMTLRFLGDMPVLSQQRLEALNAIAAGVRVAPMRFVLDRAGHFHRGRVWWLGSSEPVDALARLHQALARNGEDPQSDRRFVPHVTIGRDAGTALSVPIEPIDWAPVDFVLVDSTPERGYRVLGRWPLRA